VKSCPFCLESDAALPGISRHHGSKKSSAKLRVLLHPNPHSSTEPLQEIVGQEFIVETPDHAVTSASLSETHYLNLLETIKTRYLEIALDPRVKQPVLEKDQSRQSLGEHACWKLKAFGKVSGDLDTRMRIARRQFPEGGRHIFCFSLEPGT
jgi:hypothetical protein